MDVLHGDGPCSVSGRLSDDPMKVAYAAEEIAKIFHQNHFLSTGKHFPGGKGGIKDVAVDTHLVEAAATSTVEDLMKFDIPPYKHLMEKGLLDCIMTTHTVYANIDSQYPATVSKKVVDIIRNMGYDGVIFTDSLSMSGIKQRYSEDTLLGMAVAAGHDILLPCFNTPTKDCIKLLKKNYEDGLITEERLNEAVRHVLEAQDLVGQTPENPTVFTEEDEKLLINVAKDCVTAVTDEGISPVLTDDVKQKLFVVIEEEKKIDEEQGEINISPWYQSKRVGEKIKQEFPEATVAYLPPLSNTSDHSRVLNLAKYYFTLTRQMLGKDAPKRQFKYVDLPMAEEEFVKKVFDFYNTQSTFLLRDYDSFMPALKAKKVVANSNAQTKGIFSVGAYNTFKYNIVASSASGIHQGSRDQIPLELSLADSLLKCAHLWLSSTFFHTIPLLIV